jgi:hypothetical protein
MPHQFENPEAAKVADKTVSKESEQKGNEHVAEKAAVKGAKTEQKYDKDHKIFSIWPAFRYLYPRIKGQGRNRSMPEISGEFMESATVNHFPLNSAYLCQDCDTVGNNGTQCPACASHALMGMAVVFGRKEGIVDSNLFLVPALAAWPSAASQRAGARNSFHSRNLPGACLFPRCGRREQDKE